LSYGPGAAGGADGRCPPPYNAAPFAAITQDRARGTRSACLTYYGTRARRKFLPEHHNPDPRALFFSRADDRLSYESVRGDCVLLRRGAGEIPHRQSTLRDACKPAAERATAMLSSLRFIIGAVLAGATLYVSALGLLATARLKHMAKAGPIEVSRHLLFDDRVDWNQFYDPDTARRFEKLARRPEASEPAETSDLGAPRIPELAAPEASIEPSTRELSEQHPDQSPPTSPPLAVTVESNSPDHDESGTGDPFPAQSITQAVTGSRAPASDDTPAETPGTAAATEAPASSVEPDGDITSAIAPSESSGQRQSSPPVGDEELPVIPPPPVFPPLAAPNLDERKTGATALAGSAIAPPAAPLAARAAAHPTDRALAPRPRKITLKARAARDLEPDEPEQKTRVAKRPQMHTSHTSRPAPTYHDAPPSLPSY
jgi:hypothetical protein